MIMIIFDNDNHSREYHYWNFCAQLVSKIRFVLSDWVHLQSPIKKCALPTRFHEIGNPLRNRTASFIVASKCVYRNMLASIAQFVVDEIGSWQLHFVVWGVSERCLGSVWEVSERCLGGFRSVFSRRVLGKTRPKAADFLVLQSVDEIYGHTFLTKTTGCPKKNDT